MKLLLMVLFLSFLWGIVLTNFVFAVYTKNQISTYYDCPWEKNVLMRVCLLFYAIKNFPNGFRIKPQLKNLDVL